MPCRGQPTYNRGSPLVSALTHHATLAYYRHAVFRCRLRKHVGGGLATKYGDGLQDFAVAGKDGKHHWAKAVIDGDSVVVSSSEVPQPVAVHYA